MAAPETQTTGEPIAALEERLAADGVEFVRFEQSDTHGISRSKTDARPSLPRTSPRVG